MLAYAVSHTDVRLYLKRFSWGKKKIYKNSASLVLWLYVVLQLSLICLNAAIPNKPVDKRGAVSGKKNVLIILYYHFKRVAPNRPYGYNRLRSHAEDPPLQTRVSLSRTWITWLPYSHTGAPLIRVSVCSNGADTTNLGTNHLAWASYSPILRT